MRPRSPATYAKLPWQLGGRLLLNASIFTQATLELKLRDFRNSLTDAEQVERLFEFREDVRQHNHVVGFAT
jgi:hypothetical protein